MANGQTDKRQPYIMAKGKLTKDRQYHGQRETGKLTKDRQYHGQRETDKRQTISWPK